MDTFWQVHGEHCRIGAVHQRDEFYPFRDFKIGEVQTGLDTHFSIGAGAEAFPLEAQGDRFLGAFACFWETPDP
jgi:hypothetical protein